ncbi:hypothetical protein DFH06DRAFT_63115 [Mycena polygramma]|nr:hypothetical protein DFH06DRAFT_63115 [Mycena polygramma]
MGYANCIALVIIVALSASPANSGLCLGGVTTLFGTLKGSRGREEFPMPSVTEYCTRPKFQADEFALCGTARSIRARSIRRFVQPLYEQ